jgi:hypothetical protein
LMCEELFMGYPYCSFDIFRVHVIVHVLFLNLVILCLLSLFCQFYYRFVNFLFFSKNKLFASLISSIVFLFSISLSSTLAFIINFGLVLL